MDKTTRAAIRGIRLFNTLLRRPRAGKNITGFLCTAQSGSPPGAGHATVRCWFVGRREKWAPEPLEKRDLAVILTHEIYEDRVRRRRPHGC
jgi:hypothetical protein